MALSGTPYVRLRATPPPLKRIPYVRLVTFLVVGALGLCGLVMFLNIQASQDPLMTREPPAREAHVPDWVLKRLTVPEPEKKLEPAAVTPVPALPAPVVQTMPVLPDHSAEVAALKGRLAEMEGKNKELHEALTMLMKSTPVSAPPPVAPLPPLRLAPAPKAAHPVSAPAPPAPSTEPKPDPKVLADKEAWASPITMIDNRKADTPGKSAKRSAP